MTTNQNLGPREYHLKVEPNQSGQRLDVFLAAALGPELSRSRLQHLIQMGGRVQVQGKNPKASLRVSGGEQIIVKVPPPRSRWQWWRRIGR